MKKPFVIAFALINGTIAFAHGHDDLRHLRVIYPDPSKVTAPFSASYSISNRNG